MTDGNGPHPHTTILKSHFIISSYSLLCFMQIFCNERRKHYRMLYAFFWVIPRRLKFICRRFGTFCLFHLHRQVDACRIHSTRTYLPMKMEQSVPKRRHINFRRWGITQKKAYNIQYTAKV